MNVHQYEVYLMNNRNVITHKVNCSSIEVAKIICENIFPRYRVIEIITKF